MIFLGIDSGTQSTKTIAFDLDTGRVLGSAQRTYDLIPGLPPGHLEQHPEDWIQAVRETIGQVLQELGDRRGEVAGIGVSGQQHGLVVLDAEGEPIRPAKLWCDTSTVEECAELEAAAGGRNELIAMTGNVMLPGYTAPKLLWLKKNEPANFRRIRTVLLPHDYINFWLTGEKHMEYGDASGTALMNVKERTWCRKLVHAIDPSVEGFLPPLGSSRKPAGLLRDTLRKEFNLSTDVVVSAGGGDNMMGAIGTGNVAPGVVTVSLGTSGTIYAFSEKPVIDPQGEVAAFCDSTDHWLPLVCTMNVTVATEQVRRLFGWSHEDLEKAAASAPAGAGGLLFLPYLNGERTPNLPAGTGVFHGLTTQNMTREPMARAVMEGVTLGLAYGLRRFRELGLAPSEIRLTGGGSKSALWRQIAANIFQTETVCLQTAEGAALGAALQAAATWMEVDGQGGSLAGLTAKAVQCESSTRCSPDKKTGALYEELLDRQVDLSRRLHTAGYL
jgi:xylulokinase